MSYRKRSWQGRPLTQGRSHGTEEEGVCEQLATPVVARCYVVPADRWTGALHTHKCEAKPLNTRCCRDLFTRQAAGRSAWMAGARCARARHSQAAAAAAAAGARRARGHAKLPARHRLVPAGQRVQLRHERAERAPVAVADAAEQCQPANGHCVVVQQPPLRRDVAEVD